MCVKQGRIIRKPKRELRISRPSVQRSSFKNNRSILSENRASELQNVRRKQLNSLQGRQEIRQLHSQKQQYLWIRYSGILKIPDGVWKIEKMAAQLSSHRVHYEKSVVSLLFRKIWCV